MIIELKKLKAEFILDNGSSHIKFSWDIRELPQSAQYIYVVDCDNPEAEPCWWSLFQLSSGDSLLYRLLSAPVGVYMKRFWVFATEEHSFDPQQLQSSLAPISVLAGKAKLTYKTKRRRIDRRLQSLKISVDSSSRICAGIVQYAYSFNGLRLNYLLPGEIPKGKFDYPEIIVPCDAELILRSDHIGNIQIQETKFTLFNLGG